MIEMSLEGKKDTFPDAGKPGSKYEDNKYAGMTVGKARKEQESLYRIKMMVNQAQQKKNIGMELTEQERFILSNRELLKGD